MTPERNLIEAVLAETGEEPHTITYINAILATPAVQTALAKVRQQALEAVCYEYDEQAKPEPVLRWEGEELWLGEEPVAWVTDYPQGDAEWSFKIARTEDDAANITKARTAAEQAVRDWLKRAGVV